LIRVPREVTYLALRKGGVEEWLVNGVMAMYEGAQTTWRYKTVSVKVVLHQASVLSPLLFMIVGLTEIITRELPADLPVELLYAIYTLDGRE